jgi:hypothetical protein
MSERWHLSKAISLSHIATTATMIVLMIMYVANIEKDVAVLKAQQLNTVKKFDRIEGKLDRILILIHESK